MPAVLKYVPPTDAARSAFSQEVVRERTSRRNSYNTALKYYLGEMDDQLVVDSEANVDDNVNINLVKMTADRTATFLFPSVPRFKTDPSSIKPTEEEIWIEDFIESNGGLQLLVKMVLRGFLSGHTFVQVKPARKKKKYPRISLLDPMTVTIYWNAEDVDEVIWYETRALVGKIVHIYDFVHDVNTDRWNIYHYSSVPQKKNELETIVETTMQEVYADYRHAIDKVYFGEGGWKKVDEADHPDVGIPPIIEIPHLPHPMSRYALGEFDLKDLQDTINLIASLRNQVVRESGVPVDVITGAGTAEVDTKDDIWVVDSPNANVSRLQLKGDLTGMTTMLEKLIETYLALSRVVLLKGEAKDLQRVTNASVRTLFLDQIAKNSLLQASYGKGLEEIILLGLKMSDLPTAGRDFDLDITFPNPLPTDYTELANQLQIITNIGAVSKRTVATKMDLNWNYEQEAMESEREQDLQQQREQMELIQEIAPEPEEGTPPGNDKEEAEGAE